MHQLPTTPGVAPFAELPPATRAFAGSWGACGRAKHLFTREQQAMLEEAFLAQPYPTRDDRAIMAGQLGVREVQVQHWFQNRRARGKTRGENYH